MTEQQQQQRFIFTEDLFTVNGNTSAVAEQKYIRTERPQQ